MSKMSKKMDKQIQKMIGQYVKETDPDKAQELMQQIRELAEDQKTLDDIELRHQPIKRNKIVEMLKNRKEKKEIENEILKEALKEAVKNGNVVKMEDLVEEPEPIEEIEEES